MHKDVKVKIDLTKPIGKLSFGYPLILSIGTAKAYTECTSLADVVTAGYEATTNVYKAAAVMLSQPNPPAKFAVCGIDSASEITEYLHKEWRQLVVADGEVADVATQIATTANKMLFATKEVTSTSDRVIGFGEDYLYSAALAGEAAGRDVGSFTYKNLILNGVDPVDISNADLDTLHKNNKFTLVTKAGDNVTTEGIACSGEYIDLIDCKDYVIQQLEYETQKALNRAGKIPYDDTGIAILESVAVNVMKDCFNKGIIATNEDGTPAYTVNYAKRSATSEADRVARKYIGGQFSFTLASPIHEVEITGEIII